MYAGMRQWSDHASDKLDRGTNVNLEITNMIL